MMQYNSPWRKNLRRVPALCELYFVHVSVVPFMCRSAVTKFVSGANIFRRMPHEFIPDADDFKSAPQIEGKSAPTSTDFCAILTFMPMYLLRIYAGWNTQKHRKPKS